jgi:hypothetical protein
MRLVPLRQAGRQFDACGTRLSSVAMDEDRLVGHRQLLPLSRGKDGIAGVVQD